jgi:hypothetical protein
MSVSAINAFELARLGDVTAAHEAEAPLRLDVSELAGVTPL